MLGLGFKLGLLLPKAILLLFTGLIGWLKIASSAKVALVKFLLEVGGILLVETGSERAEDGILEVEVTASGLIGCIVASKLFKADCKVNRLIA